MGETKLFLAVLVTIATIFASGVYTGIKLKESQLKESTKIENLRQLQELTKKENLRF